MIFDIWKWVLSDPEKFAPRFVLILITAAALGLSLGLIIRTALS